jgi:carbonic anhydrase
MKAIIEGVCSFRENEFKEHRELFQTLAHGQHPRYLFITCSDSRIVPHLVTDSGPGDLFVIRNAGNIVPPASAGPSGEAASIEYAVAVLKVKHLIVCGHSHCGAMAALFMPEHLEALPAVKGFLKHAEQVRRTMRAKYPRLEGEERVLQAVKENVLVQLGHIRSMASVSAAVKRGELQTHGWVYLMDEGEVLSYDATSRQFIPAETWLKERSPV